MPVRRPIVVIDGRLKGLPAGDALPGVPSLEAGETSVIRRGDMHVRGDELLPALPDMTSWSGWGSSSMALLSADMQALAEQYGSAWYNGAQSGELAEHTLARLGSRPALLTVTGGSIPSSGSVEVTASNMAPDASLAPYTGTLAGVAGTLSSTDTALTFTRAADGTAVAVAADTPFISTPGADHRADVVFLWVGKNSLVSGATGTEIYRWTTSLDAAQWTPYSATVSNASGLLRFTNNTADSGDAQITRTVVAGRTYIVRANLAGTSAGFSGTPQMHLGNAASPYGGYGFGYAFDTDHAIVATDDLLSIYIETGTAGLDEWVELSEVHVYEDGIAGEVVAQQTFDVFNWLSPLVKRCIVLGHFVDTNTPEVSAERDRIMACNAELARRLGPVFVDVHAWATGPQIWEDLGITPTAEDSTQQSLGNKPPSASNGDLHFSAAAHLALRDHLIAPKLATLGWEPLVVPMPFEPSQLFANGELGTIQDPSDISSLSQEDSGTDRVTAYGQQVGSMLDQLAVLGDELCPPLSELVWDLEPGVTQVDGVLRFTNAGGFNANEAPVLVPVVDGKTYLLKFTVENFVSGSVRVYLYGTDTFQVSGRLFDNGEMVSAITLATGGSYNEVVTIQTGTDNTYDITSISVRELFGAHGLQAVETILPTYELVSGVPAIVYSSVDGDELISTFEAALGSNCTVARAIPGVGAEILTGQTIGTSFTDNVTHAGLVIINRALTADETADLTAYLNAKAGV